MAHGLEEVGLAVHLGERGGGRSVARCRCGWHSRSTLTVSFALAELEAHVATAPAA
jgi:hypothetical protein